MRKALLSTLVIATAAVGGPAMAAGASPAGQPAAAPAASCANPPDGQRTINYVTSLSNYYHTSKVVSAWVRYPLRASRSVTEGHTITVTANLSAEVKANFSLWKIKIAQAKGHASVTSTYKHRTSSTYTFYLTPKRGHRDRIMLYHITKRFTAVRKTWSPSKCRYVQLFATHNSAPIKGIDGDVYGIQTTRI